jgi:hypothetical protein
MYPVRTTTDGGNGCGQVGICSQPRVSPLCDSPPQTPRAAVSSTLVPHQQHLHPSVESDTMGNRSEYSRTISHTLSDCRRDDTTSREHGTDTSTRPNTLEMEKRIVCLRVHHFPHASGTTTTQTMGNNTWSAASRVDPVLESTAWTLHSNELRWHAHHNCRSPPPRTWITGGGLRQMEMDLAWSTSIPAGHGPVPAIQLSRKSIQVLLRHIGRKFPFDSITTR